MSANPKQIHDNQPLNLNATLTLAKDFDQETLFNTILTPLMKAYAEIIWFADPNVAATTEQTGNASNGTKSWTQMLSQKGYIDTTSKKYIELERMLHSIVCLHLLKDGSDQAYRYWIKAQGPGALQQKDFQNLHSLINTLIKQNKDAFKILEANLVYSDLGKTPEAKKRALQFNIHHPDHDDFMEAIYTANPKIRAQIIPSFQVLPQAVQLGILALHQAVPLHWGHAIHLEGGEKMFHKLLSAHHHPQAEQVHQAYISQICDVAASAAHINLNGAVAFNHSAYLGYESVVNTVFSVLKSRNAKIALQTLMQDRMTWLGYSTEAPSSSASKTTAEATTKMRILCRLGAFLRFYSKEEGQALKEAAESRLQSNDWQLLIQVFDIDQGVNLWNRNPTYMTTVLLNLQSTLTGHPLLKRCQSILDGAVILANIIQRAEQFNCHQLLTPICFNTLAGQVRLNPKWLSRNDFTIFNISFTIPHEPTFNRFFLDNVNEEQLTTILAITNLPKDPILFSVLSFCFNHYSKPHPEISEPPLKPST